MNPKNNFVKRNIKDLIFRNGICSPQNLPEIYKSIHQENKVDMEENNYLLVYIDSFFTNQIINDVSFLNKEQKNLIFIEAVSSWNKKSLIWYAQYLIPVFNLLKSHYEQMNLFEIRFEFYILSTGKYNPDWESIHLSEIMHIKNWPEDVLPDINFKIISEKLGNVPEEGPINTYFKFCNIQTEIFEEYGRTATAFKELINRCIQNHIMVDFFEKHREEIMEGLGKIYTQEEVFDYFLNEAKKEYFDKGEQSGFTKGEQKGVKETKESIYRKLLKSGMPEELAYKTVYDS